MNRRKYFSFCDLLKYFSGWCSVIFADMHMISMQFHCVEKERNKISWIRPSFGFNFICNVRGILQSIPGCYNVIIGKKITHERLMFLFCTPWKFQKMSDFLIFEGYRKGIWTWNRLVRKLSVHCIRINSLIFNFV